MFGRFMDASYPWIMWGNAATCVLNLVLGEVGSAAVHAVIFAVLLSLR